MNFIALLKVLLLTFAPSIIDLIFSFFAPRKEENITAKKLKANNPKISLLLGTTVCGIIIVPLAAAFVAGFQFRNNTCEKVVITSPQGAAELCVVKKERIAQLKVQ